MYLVRSFFKKIIAVSALCLAGIGCASAVPITGSVSSSPGGGIIATSPWNGGAETLSWNVDQLLNGTWKYIYTLDVTSKNISHFILGVSPTFSALNILQGTTPGLELGVWGPQGNSNPGIPAPLYGIKWSGTSLHEVFTLVSDRAPIEADFYAKDGVNALTGADVYSYNIGFGFAHQNLVNNSPHFGFIVGPDTVTTSRVPEPITAALLGIGLIGMAGVSRRKNKQV